ncbi:MAG: 2-oxo-4-hydroxy-4-carboxy-5-ureidoimidazoline decarboxylase [Alphaproteobacteria bacterium]|nr:2-oxo-4-hydroxy-4-carboxy-5-ureidoimidazoline decarboxylase [Alphaproteobacteria bacterium]
MRLAEINAMDRAAFVATLGAIYEHSPWVADSVSSARPFADRAALEAAMAAVVANAGADTQLALIRAHPDLAGCAARSGTLGAHSTAEQTSAGLDRLSDAEFERFHRLNDAYRRRFGFPFIVAVRDHTKASILDAFERRLAHDADAERREALANIKRIAALRLAALIREP